MILYVIDVKTVEKNYLFKEKISMFERIDKIDEMARAMCFRREHCNVESCTKVNCETTWLASKLYNEGYGK